MASTGIPYFKTWLIFSITSTLIAMAIGFAAGAVMGAILGAAGVDVVVIGRVGAALGFVLGLIVSFLMFRWVVNRYIVPAVAAPAAGS